MAFLSALHVVRAANETQAAQVSPSRPHRPHAPATRMVKTPVAPSSSPARETTTTPLRGERWVVTVCGAPADVTALFDRVERELTAQGGHAERWRRLGARAHELVCLVSSAREEPLRRALNVVGLQSGADIVLQAECAVRGGKRLAVFDLDSTLIAEETIDELAKEAGASGRVQLLTKRAMAGELGFREALAERVSVLKGLDVEALERVKKRATYTPGAVQLTRILGRMGVTTAVVSGGFKFLAEHVRDTLGLDYSFANTLEVVDGKLTGRTVGEVVDAEFKAKTLVDLAESMQMPPERCMAVGDGSNDVIMLQRAGLGIAFNAKPKVQSASKARVNQPSLMNVLYLLGLDDDDIERLGK